ncbi:hypothetical protein C8T65DRAFT_639506 [Cerioporus squamosus]|nr:hypothetical protein C8T65DRAFT_639506 [Cerioporus squamosus]
MGTMSATSQSGLKAPRTVREQFALAVQDLEQLIDTDTDHLVSDEEIDGIRGLLHRSNQLLTRLSNARRGANRLPAELLHVIFLQSLRPVNLARYFAKGPSWYDRHHSDEVGWPQEHKRVCDVLALAHVCQRWRSVALAFPELWQSVSVFSRGAGSTFLARAEDKPLSVLAIAKGPSEAGWLNDMCAECAPAMRQLLWVSPSQGLGQNREYAMSELDIKAPVLERLCMARGVGDQQLYRSRSIFRGDTSRVKYLAIIELHWVPRNQFPALTHLILTERIHPYELGTFLERCPNLRTLVCRTTRPWEQIEPMRTISLPHLRRISLECPEFPDNYLFNFLAKLEFDRSRAAIRVSFIGYAADTFGHQRNLLVAPPHPQDSMPGPEPRSSAPYTHLCIKATGPPHGPSSFTMFATSATGGVCVQGDSAIQHMVQYSFPLQHIRELWIDGLTKEVPEVLMLWRRALTALRTLVVVRRPPPLTEVFPNVPAFFVGGPQKSRRGGPTIMGPAHAREMGVRVLDDRRWESADAVFAHLKTIFGIPFMPGTHPVRMFVSDGQGTIKKAELEPWMTVTGLTLPAAGGDIGEVPTAMLMPEVCTEDPELTAWEGW